MGLFSINGLSLSGQLCSKALEFLHELTRLQGLLTGLKYGEFLWEGGICAPYTLNVIAAELESHC